MTKFYKTTELNNFTTENLMKEFLSIVELIMKNLPQITDIYDTIEKKHGKKGSWRCPGVTVFKNLMKGTHESKKLKMQIIEFIIFLQEEYKVSCKVSTPEDDNNEGDLYYDVFYWRVDGSNNETIGIAKLRIYENRVDVDLKYFYHSKDAPDAILKGTMVKHSKNIYIKLEDKTNDGIQTDTFLILHSKSNNLTSFLTGNISSGNRIKEIPISSIVVLEKTTNENLDDSPYLSDFFEVAKNTMKRRVYLGDEKINETGKRGVDHRIIYYLSGRQIRTENSETILTTLEDLPTDNDFQKMKDFEGTYQNIYVLTSSLKPLLRSFIIEITQGGLAKITKDKNKESKEVGRARIVLNQTKVLLLVQLNYSQSTRVYQYSLLLEKNQDGYLEGVYLGVVNTQQSSGRVILKSVESNTLPKGIIELENKNLIDELSNITNSDSNIINFFTGNKIDANTDVGLRKLLESSIVPQIQPPNTVDKNRIDKDLEGCYECFFNVKKVEIQSSDNDSSKYGQILYSVPLYISQNEIFLKYHDDILRGRCVCDNKKIMLIFESTVNSHVSDYYITILIRPSEKPNIIYGLINVITDKNNKNIVESIQSSYFIMQRCISNQNFDKLMFKNHENLTELVTLEKEKHGLVTKVFGHYNRTILIREPNNLKYDKHPRWKAYRRTFWNSACFNASRYQETGNEEYIEYAHDDLLRAYHHGFGMKYWSDKEFNQPTFPKDLQEEYEMIVDEYEKQKYFKDEKCRNFLKKQIEFNLAKSD